MADNTNHPKQFSSRKEVYDFANDILYHKKLTSQPLELVKQMRDLAASQDDDAFPPALTLMAEFVQVHLAEDVKMQKMKERNNGMRMLRLVSDMGEWGASIVDGLSVFEPEARQVELAKFRDSNLARGVTLEAIEAHINASDRWREDNALMKSRNAEFVEKDMKVYTQWRNGFETFRPTPNLPYAVRLINCCRLAGITPTVGRTAFMISKAKTNMVPYPPAHFMDEGLSDEQERIALQCQAKKSMVKHICDKGFLTSQQAGLCLTIVRDWETVHSKAAKVHRGPKFEAANPQAGHGEGEALEKVDEEK